MTIYEKNLSKLKEFRNQLYIRVKEFKSCDENNTINLDSCEAKDGTKVLIVESNDKIYRLNSNYNPNQEADRWAEQFKSNYSNCVISFFGLGNGIFVRSLAKKIKNGDAIILYEPNMSIFLYVLKEFDITDIIENENIYFIFNGINEMEFRGILNKLVDWNNLGSQILCCHPYYDQIYIYEYKQFLKKIKENNSLTFVNRNTLALMGKASVKNTIHNFEHIKNSNIISDLTNMFPKDVPAIIVSAGPSLDKNISDLKLAKNKSVIFATERTVDFLLDCGIEPDFIVTLDAIKPLQYFSKRENLDIPMFCKIESNSDILDFHKGKKIWYDSNQFLIDLYKKFDKKFVLTNTGGSVATASFSICMELKFKNIILIGQDLAYSGDYTHAGGVLKDENSITEYVEDIYGNIIPSRYDWKIFKLWFEDTIENFPEVNVIDATEGGAKIEGTKIMTLQEAIEQNCNIEINCKDIINNLSNTIDYDIVIEYINDALEELNDIDITLENAVQICDKLIKNYKKKKVNLLEEEVLIDMLPDINKNIIEKKIYTLIDTYIADSAVEYLPNVNTYSGKSKEDQRDTFVIARKVYEDMKEATIEVRKLLKELVEKIG